MFSHQTYRPKTFQLSGLQGISDETLAMHFKLYEGYVEQTNLLNEKIAEILGSGKIDQESMPAYSELTRRLGFEYNGMVLHEYYFGNLTKGGGGAPPASFKSAAEASYGSFETWKADFVGVCKMRGVGWAICYQDPLTSHLSNHWITLHEVGNVTGFTPVLVVDVWEHAFLKDYAPSERGKYIDACFANVDWTIVERRLNAMPRAPQRAAGGTRRS
jgi:Fe-Mn family superoxide dismutase